MVARAVRDGFLSIVTPGSQISPMSLDIKWEEELRLSIKGAPCCRPGHLQQCTTELILGTGIPSAKEIKEIKEMLKTKKADWMEEERERAQGRVRRTHLRSGSFHWLTL